MGHIGHHRGALGWRGRAPWQHSHVWKREEHRGGVRDAAGKGGDDPKGKSPPGAPAIKVSLWQTSLLQGPSCWCLVPLGRQPRSSACKPHWAIPTGITPPLGASPPFLSAGMSSLLAPTPGAISAPHAVALGDAPPPAFPTFGSVLMPWH